MSSAVTRQIWEALWLTGSQDRSTLHYSVLRAGYRELDQPQSHHHICSDMLVRIVPPQSRWRLLTLH